MAIIAASGILHMPAHVHRLAVYESGRKLVALSDPAADTCSAQTAFVASRRRPRIVAEYVSCFHELENFTRRQLVVRWS